MKNKIDKIIQEYSNKIKDSRIFFKPDIPEKKLANAIESLQVNEPSGDVLTLIDDSLLGSGKEGLILTYRKIYAKNAFENPKYYDLTAIQGAQFSRGVMQSVLVINNNNFFTSAIPDNTNMTVFSDMLSIIINTIDETVGPSNNKDSMDRIKTKLAHIKTLYESGLIEEDEYKTKKQEILSEI